MVNFSPINRYDIETLCLLLVTTNKIMIIIYFYCSLFIITANKPDSKLIHEDTYFNAQSLFREFVKNIVRK